jgi:hypothetical protein
MDVEVDERPVVEAGAAEVAVLEREAEAADQVERGAGRSAQAGDRPGVLRDLRLDEDDRQRAFT